MRPVLAATLLACLPALALGQDVRRDSLPRPRSVTVTAGWGNAMGWLGLQGEKYLRSQRVSVFGGLGYTPELEDGDASGITVAAGVRGYTPGDKHRGFLELSVSQLAIEQFCYDACHRYYGPGLQAGYQFVSRGGFTLGISLGLGYAPGVSDGLSSVGALAGLGLGYTWRR